MNGVMCKYCGKEWLTDEDAEECEKKHEKKKDSHYSQYQLNIAAEVPSQRKLSEW